MVFLLGFLCSSYSFDQDNSSGKLIIKVSGVRNQNGKIIISIFKSADGFPGKPSKAEILAVGEINKNTAQVTVENIPFGDYAVSLVHDENDNKKMETNFLGIPNEGIGTSNDAKGTFGPPKFEQAKFKFSKDNQKIKINMVYY